MKDQPIYHLISDEELEHIQGGDLAVLKEVRRRPDVMDLIDGRLEGLRSLLDAPEDAKTMSNKELEFAIAEIQIIRDCLEVSV